MMRIKMNAARPTLGAGVVVGSAISGAASEQVAVKVKVVILRASDEDAQRISTSTVSFT